MNNFTTVPHSITAWQLTPENVSKGVPETIKSHLSKTVDPSENSINTIAIWYCYSTDDYSGSVITVYGHGKLNQGDWLIYDGTNFYPCKNETFKKKYEATT